VSLRAEYPLLRSSRFLHGEPVAPRLKDVAWFKPDGEEKRAEHWADPVAKCVGVSLAGGGKILLLLFNSDAEPIEYIFPFFGRRHVRWRILCDSANGLVRPEPVQVVMGKTTIPARGLLLLERTN
jgi:glycogen operon protein